MRILADRAVLISLGAVMLGAILAAAVGTTAARAMAHAYDSGMKTQVVVHFAGPVPIAEGPKRPVGLGSTFDVLDENIAASDLDRYEQFYIKRVWWPDDKDFHRRALERAQPDVVVAVRPGRWR